MNCLWLRDRPGHVFESQFHMVKCGNVGFTSFLAKAAHHLSTCQPSAALCFSPIIVLGSSVIVVCIITCYYHFICLPAQATPRSDQAESLRSDIQILPVSWQQR